MSYLIIVIGKYEYFVFSLEFYHFDSIVIIVSTQLKYYATGSHWAKTIEIGEYINIINEQNTMSFCLCLPYSITALMLKITIYITIYNLNT